MPSSVSWEDLPGDPELDDLVDAGATSDQDEAHPRQSQSVAAQAGEREVELIEQLYRPFRFPGGPRTIAELQLQRCDGLLATDNRMVQKAYRDAAPGAADWFPYVHQVPARVPDIEPGPGRPTAEVALARREIKVAAVASARPYQEARLQLTPLNPLITGPQPGRDYEPEFAFPIPVAEWPFRQSATRGSRWRQDLLDDPVLKEAFFDRRNINIFSTAAIDELYSAAVAAGLLVEVDVTPAHMQGQRPQRVAVSTSLVASGRGKGQFTPSRQTATRAYCEFVLYRGLTDDETGPEPNARFVAPAYAGPGEPVRFYSELPAHIRVQVAAARTDADRLRAVSQWLDSLKATRPLDYWVYVAEHNLTLVDADVPGLRPEPPMPEKWVGGRGRKKPDYIVAQETDRKAWEAEKKKLIKASDKARAEKMRKGKAPVGEEPVEAEAVGPRKQPTPLWIPIQSSVQARAQLSYIVWRHTRRLTTESGEVKCARFPPATDLSHRGVLFENPTNITGWKAGWQLEVAVAERQSVNNSRISCVTLLSPITRRAADGTIEFIPPLCEDSPSLCPHTWAPCWGPVLVDIEGQEVETVEVEVGKKEARPSGRAREIVSPRALKRAAPEAAGPSGRPRH